MKAIDTFYNGNYFRSRLEARWAFFFDQAGIKYLYEPEGFKSEKGICYLPDFYLPDTYLRNKETKGIYIEIKPEHFNTREFTHDAWFGKPLCLFVGNPENHIWYAWNNHNLDCERGYQLFPPWDNCMVFFICNKCGTSKIEYAEENYNQCPVCEDGENDELKLSGAGFNSTHKRFEHGAL